MRSTVGERSAGAPATRSAVELRRRAADVQSGEARAAVLGVNDGLVTNTSLILGVAGATTAPDVVQLAGLASLVAGAGSMAIGEWVSMRAQVELLERLLTEERAAIAADPDRERAILQNAMERAGFDEAACTRAAAGLFRDPERALRVYARSVLGVNPDELGSPWRSAVSSLVAFSVGAVAPLAPWFFSAGSAAIAASLGIAAVAALVIGGLLGQLTGGRWLRGALRQLVFVVAAAGVTFAVGKLFGTTMF
ncbi:MAG TPA: VIT1/CCC1 transporter family protein [Burkholderiales bacterium]|nr:VIT1/CCC1 transporter family protein [Burkholderiales bacterium]